MLRIVKSFAARIRRHRTRRAEIRAITGKPSRSARVATILFVLAGCILLVWGFGLHAEEYGETGPVEFAPGSTGQVKAPIAGIVKDAEELGQRLREGLVPQNAPSEAFGDIDFDTLRDRALANPRVRALLGAEETEALRAGGEKQRFEGAKVFLLASFSIPRPSLRQMMQEARAHDIPIVFRGFVNNSVYDTRAALEETFGTVDDSLGFAIDPTVFTRFRVTSVPQVIAVDETIDVCETPGCEGDPIPPHDVVRGNLPLRYALKLIADHGEVGHEEAVRLLDEGGDYD